MVDTYLLPTSKSCDTKTRTKIKKSGPNNLRVLCPNLRIRSHLPAPIINGGGDSHWKWLNFRLSRAHDLDLDLDRVMLHTKLCIIYLTKKSPASQTVATVWMSSKICQGQSPTMCSKCSRFHLNQFTFGGVKAKRVNTTKSCRKVNPIFDRMLALSRIITITLQRRCWLHYWIRPA